MLNKGESSHKTSIIYTLKKPSPISGIIVQFYTSMVKTSFIFVTHIDPLEFGLAQSSISQRIISHLCFNTLCTLKHTYINKLTHIDIHILTKLGRQDSP